MPPAMHPKSFSTASLFTTTAVISFLVVAAPHVLPCPATSSERAESGAKPTIPLQERHRKKKRKCPIPRPAPSGLVGEVLGKKETSTTTKELEAFWGKKVVFEKRIGEVR